MCKQQNYTVICVFHLVYGCFRRIPKYKRKRNRKIAKMKEKKGYFMTNHENVLKTVILVAISNVLCDFMLFLDEFYIKLCVVFFLMHFSK